MPWNKGRLSILCCPYSETIEQLITEGPKPLSNILVLAGVHVKTDPVLLTPN